MKLPRRNFLHLAQALARSRQFFRPALGPSYSAARDHWSHERAEGTNS